MGRLQHAQVKRCKLCGGQLALLGTLGRLLWVRCTGCGMEFSRTARRVKPRALRMRPECVVRYE